LDNLSNSLSFNTIESYNNIQSERFIFNQGDVSDISSIYDDIKFDVIYHLASESRPLEFENKYRDIISSNINGILSVIDYIKNNNLNNKCRLVYASTSEVYGYNTGSLVEGQDLIVNPKYSRNCYSLSKMLSENILYNEIEVDWVIARFFNVYGGNFNINDTKIIPMLKRCVQEDDTFEICGDGNQTRSFTHIDDLVHGLFLMSCLDDIQHEVYNLGVNIQTKINDLVDMVKKYHPNLKVKHIEGRKGEPYHRLPDNNKAYNDLNWKPKISLQQGIESIFG